MDIRRTDSVSGYVEAYSQIAFGKNSSPQVRGINEQSEIDLQDTLQISDEGYRMQKDSQRMSATSGSDTLGISKGTSDNEYVVHFSDSAMVNRAVSRGYITINGKVLELSNETKEALKNVDNKAENMRRKAYESYIMQHDAAVAKQQAEAWAKAYEQLDDSLLRKLLEPENTEKIEDTPEGVSWSDFVWKTYDASMRVSMEGEPSIGDIFVGDRNVEH